MLASARAVARGSARTVTVAWTVRRTHGRVSTVVDVGIVVGMTATSVEVGTGANAEDAAVGESAVERIATTPEATATTTIAATTHAIHVLRR